jgi:hypothetical protein
MHGIGARENEMSKERLSELHRGIEAQLRWALAYEGDGELLDLLRSESERLSGQVAPKGQGGTAEVPSMRAS